MKLLVALGNECVENTNEYSRELFTEGSHTQPMNDGTQLSITVSDKDEVSGYLYRAVKGKKANVTIVLAHGAGAGQSSPFMKLFATGLAFRGADVLTFDFVYMAGKRGAPDPKAKLEACYRAVIDVAANDKRLKANSLIIGGKSMGGRIASQVAADDSSLINGVVCLGYPLHPPGNTAKLRVEHLPLIKVPVLFVQGSRDAFGSPDEIRPFIKGMKPKPTIFEIKGGDHSFKVPKTGELSQSEVYELAMDEITSWIRQL